MIDPRVPSNCSPSSREIAPAGPRAFIFGCARSGTTLLLNLFRTFHGVDVMDGEHCSSHLLQTASESWNVAKRTPHCADHLLADLKALRDVWIVDIIRDPRDVVTSKLDPWPDYYCDFARWRRDVQVAIDLQGRHRRLVHVRYEVLVTEADEVQQDLASVLGLQIAVPFSAFTEAVPVELSQAARTALGGVRPLSAKQVGRWRDDAAARQRVTEQLRMHPDVEHLLRANGYPATSEGMR